MKQAFKKIHLFDKILIIVSIAIMAIFALFFFRKSTYIQAVIKVGDESAFFPNYANPYGLDGSGSKLWLSNQFRVGQLEKDGLGNVKAEVLDVYAYDKTSLRRTVYLTLKLKAVYSRSSDTYTYKGVPVLVGSKIKLNLERLYVEGVVTDVGSQNKLTEKVTLETQIREENPTYSETSGTKAYLADAIRVGDEVRNNKGDVLIKVVAKRDVPATKALMTSDGRVILGLDPTRRQVNLTLEVLAQKVGDRYYFLDDLPLLIDQAIPVNTPTVSFFPVITKVTPSK